MAEETYPSSDTNSLLSCAICFEQFGKNREPRVLPCTHPYCHICLFKQNKKGIIECAECRKRHKVPDGGVEKFPICRTTMRLLEQHINEKRLQKAAKSETQTGSKGALSKEAHQELLTTLKDSIRAATQSGKQFEHTIDKIQSERAVLSETLETTKKTINSVMVDIAKTVTKRKNELLEELNKAYEENLALLTAQEDKYKTEKEAHKEFCSEMSKKLECSRKDGRVPSGGAPREHLERLIQETQSKDSSLQREVLVSSKRLSFNDDNYTMILSGIKSWGNLQWEHCTLKVPPSHLGMGLNLMTSNPDHEGFSHYVNKEAAVRTLGHELGTILSSPRCVTVLPNGDIAVTSAMSYEISVFASLQLKRFIRLAVPLGGSFDDGITGMCMNPMGRLCVSNPDMHAVHILTLDGETQYQLKVQATNRDDNFTPWGMACNPKGELFVCDRANHLIRVFNPSGEEVRQFGGRGREAGKFDRPSDIALMPDGDVVVADYNNHRIQVFDGQTGVFQSTFGTPGSGLNQVKGPTGIAVDSKGFIAVSEYLNNRVQLFTPTGKAFKILGTLGEGPTQFDTPRGIAINRENEIVVCDSKNDRVQIF